VLNPKTGKIFCSEKCWNKKEKNNEKQQREDAMLAKVVSLEDKLNRLVMILECIYPEMIKEKERRKNSSTSE